jgi:hypothetical protein
VANVTIFSTTNTQGTNPAYSFATVDGSEEQLRTVPVGAANRIAIQFTEDVVKPLSDLVSGDLELIALNRVVTEPTPTLYQWPDSTNGYTAIWSLSSVLPGAQYLLRLQDTIVDGDGNMLDGEWTNPGSITSDVITTIFPSGDNVEGGDFEFVFTYLPGDANRDNQVDVSDLGILSGNYNEPGQFDWGDGDFNGDGSVNVGDLGLLSTHYNKSDFRNLAILGDYDDDFDIDAANDTAFDNYYSTSNPNADLDKDTDVDAVDQAAFDALFSFGIDLSVIG